MTLTNIKTETYHIWNDFYIDIVEDDKQWEAWIYQGKAGIKTFSIGITKDETNSKDEIIKYMEKYFIERANEHLLEQDAISKMWYETP